MMYPHMIRYHPYVQQASFGLPGIIGLFLTIAFWILVILLVAKLISHFAKNNDGPVDEEMKDNKYLEMSPHGLRFASPADSLLSKLRLERTIKERYAKGEINKKEFEALKKDLVE